MTDEDGAVAGRQLYSPFGESRWREGTLPTGRGFTGAPLDETGLLFLQARYLDPALGRFVSGEGIERVKPRRRQVAAPYGMGGQGRTGAVSLRKRDNFSDREGRRTTGQEVRPCYAV